MQAPDEGLSAKSIFFKHLELNDTKHRFILMRKDVQAKVGIRMPLSQISKRTQAAIETRGKYYADKHERTEDSEPPLYLRISSEESDEHVVAALRHIKTLIQKSIAKEANKPHVSSFGYFELKLPIGMEPDKGFNIRSKIIGFSGSNMKMINTKTKAKVQIKGRGSGYLEPETNMESAEDIYLHIMGPTKDSVECAARLCQSLVSDVRREYELYKKTSRYHYNQRFSATYSAPAPAVQVPQTDIYAYYYQYYFNALGGNTPSPAATSPNAILAEIQQRHQYAAYYASAAAANTPVSAEKDPFEIAGQKDYRNVPPPPDLYKS